MPSTSESNASRTARVCASPAAVRAGVRGVAAGRASAGGASCAGCVAGAGVVLAGVAWRGRAVAAPVFAFCAAALAESATASVAAKNELLSIRRTPLSE
jgi:hypothetical protein